MALLRFVCRDLLKVFDNENKFIDQVRDFIESKALKPKHARRVIIDYYQNKPELELRLLRTLDNGFE